MKLKPLLFIVVGVAVLVALFVFLRPAPLVVETAAATPEPATSNTPSSEHHFALRIEKRALVSGPNVIRVSQGESVVLDVETDEAGHVHLHGYNLMLTLEPGKTASLKFVADRSGRFEYELEEAGVEIGALEVEPR